MRIHVAWTCSAADRMGGGADEDALGGERAVPIPVKHGTRVPIVAQGIHPSRCPAPTRTDTHTYIYTHIHIHIDMQV
jgi:hypothetical protein